MEKNDLVQYDFLKLQKVGGAIAITSKLLRKSADDYFEKALENGTLRKYEEAISDYSKAIQLDPNFTIAYAHRYTLLGIKHYDEENFEEAISCFRKTIELVDEQYSYIQLISLYIRSMDFENALHFAEIAISLFSSDSSLYLIKGNIQTFLERHNDAINDFTKAIEIECEKKTKTAIYHEAFLERAKSKNEIGDIEGSNQDNIIANALKKAWRVRNEGMTDEEKAIFGIK